MNPVQIITREVEAATEYDAEVGVGRGLARLVDDGWRIVRTDPNTEPDERPIVIEEWTGA